MKENKKILNATTTRVADISFKSQLEARLYKAMQNMGLDVDYEPQRCKIWDRQSFSVPYFDRVGKVFKRVTSKPIAVHYTPDFIFDYKGIKVFLEAKGFKNDVAPYKARLFRDWLEEYTRENHVRAVYAVVYSIRDLQQLLKELDNEPQTF